ncbi:MAG: DNA polymerase III subunit gamma/tau, partial [Planctomycetia bacterium]|nr:DNA polymerase III subunit gamma/tau [Planctomycetia bacterium]
LSKVEPFLAISGPNLLAFRLPSGYNAVAAEFDTPASRAKIEQALSALLNRPVTVRFEKGAQGPDLPPPVEGVPAAPPKRREEVLEGDPLVRKVVELFEARLLHPEYDDDPPRSPAR